MDSDTWLFVKSSIAAIGGFTAYRVFFPDSNGTPIFVAAVVIFLLLTALDEYRKVASS